MRFFDVFLLNIILLLFPLFIYLIYVLYQKSINKLYTNNFFEVALFISLFLISKFGYVDENFYVSILINIPLLLVYLKGRKTSAIIISFILIVYYITIFECNPYMIFFEYLSYFILYLLSNRKSIASDYIINNFTIIKTFIFSFFAFSLITPNSPMWVNLLKIIMSITIFYITTVFYYRLIQKIEDMVVLNDTLKELEKEKMIRNSLFKITHEIKNPIAVCKGYLDMIDINKKSKLEKYVPIIKSEINRTLSLLDDFLDYSKVKIERDVIDVIMLVEDTTRAMSELLKSSNAITNFLIPDLEVYILADYNRLKQVLVNILKNSMESKLEDRDLVINIEIDVTEDEFKLIISDNGIGMDNDELTKLGEPFYTTKERGTGIGVNLSKEIISRHNGSLIYESEKYVGTTVTIKLPIDKELNMDIF